MFNTFVIELRENMRESVKGGRGDGKEVTACCQVVNVGGGEAGTDAICNVTH